MLFLAAHNLSEHNIPKIFVQLRGISHQWKDIGRCLGFTDTELVNIEAQPTNKSTSDYLSTMLSNWGQWVPGDARGSTGYATLESIKAALDVLMLGKKAQELHL